MPYLDHEGTQVAGGKHVVPPGVAVEELDAGKKKLAQECSEELQNLLTRRQLQTVYHQMVDRIVNESKTRNVFGVWKDAEFVSILDEFRDAFADQNVRVVLCRRKAASGTRRWLEFIDTDPAPDYVPQYDVSNLSGEVIKTCYTTLEFPFGVAVEELKQWRGRKKLKEKIPTSVAELMERKDLKAEYDSLVDMVVENGVGSNSKCWNLDKIKEIIAAFRPRFEDKGVALFISHKEEYVSHGQYGGHMEHFRWIEFVDREKQPNYYPQRDMDTRKEKCVISVVLAIVYW